MIDLKKETARKLAGIIPESAVFTLFSKGLITDQTAKRFLIKEEYQEADPERGRRIETREEIASRFCVSVDTVHKYLSGIAAEKK